MCRFEGFMNAWLADAWSLQQGYWELSIDTAYNGLMIHGEVIYRTGHGIHRRRIVTFSCLYMGTALDFSDHQVYQALYHITIGDNAWI